MSQPKTIAVLAGGQSPEHAISLLSAQSVCRTLLGSGVEVTLVGILQSGQWTLQEVDYLLEQDDCPTTITLDEQADILALLPGAGGDAFLNISTQKTLPTVELVFPVLHGIKVEDGALQGVLEQLGLPYVGGTVLGSAVAMDKDVMKRLLAEAGIPCAPFICLKQMDALNEAEVEARLGFPCFVKPANTGSSIGVSRACDAVQLKTAVAEAFRYDSKVIIEQQVVGRELEVSVLGGKVPRASLAGEVVTPDHFYSYENKYLDAAGVALHIPAELTAAQLQSIQALALQTFEVLCCRGLARVDCFLTEAGHLMVNEINTMPGFTKISMYPKLWEVSGLSYAGLLESLIEESLKQQEKEHGTWWN